MKKIIITILAVAIIVIASPINHASAIVVTDWTSDMITLKAKVAALEKVVAEDDAKIIDLENRLSEVEGSIDSILNTFMAALKQILQFILTK